MVYRRGPVAIVEVWDTSYNWLESSATWLNYPIIDVGSSSTRNYGYVAMAYEFTSMGKCKKDVTPGHQQWSYVFLAPTHRHEYQQIFKGHSWSLWTAMMPVYEAVKESGLQPCNNNLICIRCQLACFTSESLGQLPSGFRSWEKIKLNSDQLLIRSYYFHYVYHCIFVHVFSLFYFKLVEALCTSIPNRRGPDFFK